MATLRAILGKKRRRRYAEETPPPPPRLQKYLPEARDLFLFGGIAGAGYGVYQIYPPSAFILVGGFFVTLGVLIYMGGNQK